MIAIVGGGLAGCAAAVKLAEAGERVVLIERSDYLGGRAGTPPGTPPAGFGPLDTGQHVFLRCCTAYMDFLRTVGAMKYVSIQPRLRIAVYDGRRPGAPPALLTSSSLPAPFHMAPSVLRYPFLSLKERLGLGRVLQAALASPRDDDILHRQTFAEWLTRLGQSEWAIQRFWDVIIVPTLNAPSRLAAADAGLMVLQEALLGGRNAANVGRAHVPLSRLLKKVPAILKAQGGDVMAGAAVRAITPRWNGGFELAIAGRPPLHARAVIAAVQHKALPKLLPGEAASDPFFRRAAQLNDVPIIDVHLLYDRPVVPPTFDFATFIHSDIQWLFHQRTEADGRAGDAQAGSQHLSITLSAAEAYTKRSNADLADHFHRELTRLFPGSRARLVAFTTTRQRRATFEPSPGSREGRLPQRTPVPGFYLAGDWTDCGWPATMEGAVRSGNLAAAALLADSRQKT